MIKNQQQNQLHKATYGLEETHPQHSIRLFIENIHKSSKVTKIAFYATIALVLAAIVIYPRISMLATFTILSLLYIAVQLFKLTLVVVGVINDKKDDELGIPDELPIYSILLPVHNEGEVLADLIQAIKRIDYPADLLDVKLIIEEDDAQTLAALKNIKLPKFIEVIKMPVSQPRTKPKACNYALQFTKGKYVTIYDAEDRPHPQQLKQVVAKFAASSEEVVCIQAKLDVYNREENIIAKLFALDYALLYEYTLPALQKLKLPIPLGGTSNHFIREKLIELGSWDAFNVTEDADLGIRIYQHGYCTEVINSVTFEEAPVTLKAWIMQRSRWIKGHILTSLLHLRANNHLLPKEKLSLYLMLFLPNLIYPLLPMYIALHFLSKNNPLLDLLWDLNVYLGAALPMIYGALIVYAKKWSNFKSIIFTTPFYYLLLSVAATRAVIGIFKNPFHWDKTQHGVSKLP
jgi:glycosyltransferase XagB